MCSFLMTNGYKLERTDLSLMPVEEGMTLIDSP